MSADFFLDTNLFIYQLEFLDEKKAKTAERIITRGIATGNACISFQIVQECLNTIRRKAEIPLGLAETQKYLQTVLFPLWTIMPSQRIYLRALSIQDDYRLSFYDALAVAAALDRGCSRLYSEDLQHGQRIEGLVIVNPFVP